MGFSYFFSAEFIRWPRSLGTPEGLLEQSHRLYLEQSSPSKGELEMVSLAESWDFFSEPKRAARDAGAIDGVTHAKLAEILPQYGSMNKSTFNRWIKQYAVGTHPYADHSAFQNMVADFRKLMEE